MLKLCTKVITYLIMMNNFAYLSSNVLRFCNWGGLQEPLFFGVLTMLNERQKIFVREYIKTNNATQSAISAGYSKKTARAIGQENLTKPDIKQAIEKEQKKNADKFEYTIEQSFENLLKAQEMAMKRTNPLGGSNPDLTNFLKAEELKGKLCGLYIEKKEISGIDQTPLEIKILG